MYVVLGFEFRAHVCKAGSQPLEPLHQLLIILLKSVIRKCVFPQKKSEKVPEWPDGL
jgi:hypothetical protein